MPTPRATAARAKPRPKGNARPAPRRWLSWRAEDTVSIPETRAYRALSWVAIAAFAVVLAWLAIEKHPIGDYMAETDFYGAYAEGAGLVQHGRLDPSRYVVIGPIYEVVLGLVGFVVRDLFVAAKLISFLSALAILVLWMRMLERRLDVRAAFAATVLIVTNGQFLRYGYSVTTDALAIAFQAVALYLLLVRGRAFAVAGAVAGVAFLTRYNAVYLLPAGLAAILWGAAGAERRGRAAALFALGFLAPVVPWVLYCLGHGSSFSFQLHHNIAYEVFARAKGIPWDDYQEKLQPQFPTLWDVIRRDPGAVFGRMLFNVGDHLRLDAVKLLGRPVAACAAIGLALGAFDGRLRRARALALAGALLFLTLVPAFHSERYSVALLPFYATLGAMAFASPIGALAWRGAGGTWLKPALVLVPAVLASQTSVKLQAWIIDQLPVEVLDCAATLRTLKQPGDRVIARKPHLAWHAGVAPEPFPFANDLQELARNAHAERARWMYFSWPEAETRPRFWHLLDTTGVVPGLAVRRVTGPHPAVLYEIGPEFGAVPEWARNDTLALWHRARGQLLVNGADVPALEAYAFAANALGRLPEARRALETALARQPRELRLHLYLGDVLLMSGDGPAAERVLQSAERLDPANVEVQVGLGWVRLFASDFTGAAARWRPMIDRTRDRSSLRKMIEVFDPLGDRAAGDAARAALARLGERS